MQRFLTVTAIAVAAVALAGCGGGSSSPGNSTPTTSTTSTGSHASGNAGSKFSTAKIKGTGTVLVDANGRTVYVLTISGKKNVPCTGATGCTTQWPDIVLSGTAKPKAGSGVDASLLSTMKVGGKSYPTYNGYLMYEYTGDTGPGQANGAGQLGMGGTWYPLSPSGKPLNSGGAYGY